MTKAIALFNFLMIIRKLKSFATEKDISYHFIHSIAQQKSLPSYKIMCKLYPDVPSEWWFEKATEEFVNDLENIINEKGFLEKKIIT